MDCTPLYMRGVIKPKPESMTMRSSGGIRDSTRRSPKDEKREHTPPGYAPGAPYGTRPHGSLELLWQKFEFRAGTSSGKQIS